MVTVKPLDWRPDTFRGGFGGFVGDVQYRYVCFDWGGPRYGIDNYDTIETAKASAQRDHDAYIRNAIEDRPDLSVQPPPDYSDIPF